MPNFPRINHNLWQSFLLKNALHFVVVFGRFNNLVNRSITTKHATHNHPSALGHSEPTAKSLVVAPARECQNIPFNKNKRHLLKLKTKTLSSPVYAHSTLLLVSKTYINPKHLTLPTALNAPSKRQIDCLVLFQTEARYVSYIEKFSFAHLQKSFATK